jgi:predicted nucleotidyltransferase
MMRETRSAKIDSELLDEVLRRIRTTAQPEQVILFGSQSRGEAGPDSDLDLLIVMDTDLPRHKRPLPFYRALAGLGLAKDIVVYTPFEVEEWKTASCSLVATALREGTVLYEDKP